MALVAGEDQRSPHGRGSVLNVVLALTQPLLHHHPAGTAIILILKMKKLRYREVWQIVPSPKSS